VSDVQPSLGQLIWLVRRELEWAHQVDADQPLRFDVDSVNLDVVVEVRRSTSGGGGLDLTIMGVGGKADVSRESEHTAGSIVHIVLKPSDTRTVSGKYQVSALDIEPPPRWAASRLEADESPHSVEPKPAIDTES
jgi:hypothetical protein